MLLERAVAATVSPYWFLEIEEGQATSSGYWAKNSAPACSHHPAVSGLALQYLASIPGDDYRRINAVPTLGNSR
jgi:hypothetical protein